MALHFSKKEAIELKSMLEMAVKILEDKLQKEEVAFAGVSTSAPKTGIIKKVVKAQSRRMAMIEKRVKRA